MRIQTKFFDDIEIKQSQCWYFPKGIPGFEEEREFALLSIEGNTTFQVLQSLKEREVALIVANPYEIVDDFSFDIDESTISLLEIKEEKDVFVLCVLSLKDPFETSTINLQAPIIFQTKNNLAKQMILNDSKFSIRQKIAIQSKSEGEA